MAYAREMNAFAAEIGQHLSELAVIGMGAVVVGGLVVLTNEAINFLEDAQERQAQAAFERESIK